MEPLYIQASEETPEVVLDAKKNIFKFTGRSFVQNSVLFYDPILRWFVDYFAHPNSTTNIEFKFDYINSSSQKRIIEIILKIQHLHLANNSVKVLWYYKADDEDMLEKGQEFAEYFSVPFKFEAY